MHLQQELQQQAAPTALYHSNLVAGDSANEKKNKSSNKMKKIRKPIQLL
jgi:hypothetical protein